jgi:hypothetical protein
VLVDLQVGLLRRYSLGGFRHYWRGFEGGKGLILDLEKDRGLEDPY